MAAQACTAAAATEARPRALDLADVVREVGAQVRAGQFLNGEQLQALRAIEACRTSALGGHLESCDHCHGARVVYHSCRNRNCAKCQGLVTRRWVETHCARLLPVQHFHVVFTLPHELNPLLLRHPRLLYGLLFRAAAETLQEFARDPKHLGAELGITAVLHTWSQKLTHHPHLHCLVTGGGLAPDGKRWLSTRPRFLFPVQALSQVFRGKYLAGLQRATRRGELQVGDGWPELLERLYEHRWVVYCKPPFRRPEQVIDYLGRYTHRIAISHDRLVSLKDGVVRFRYRDRAAGDVQRTLSLPAEEFLQRFLLHVLPRGFMRIRHFGLLANRYRKLKLQRCRELLGQVFPPTGGDAPVAGPEPETREDAAAMMLRLTGVDVSLCPACKQGRMRRTLNLEKGQAIPAGVKLLDSS